MGTPPSPSRILVVGHKGMLGTDLMETLAREWPDAERFGLDLPEFDITQFDSIRGHVQDLKPDAIINCAAYTNVDGCETETDLAMAVNRQGPGSLARVAKEAGVRLVHVSTDFVFDGAKDSPYVEEDEPNPQSAYGRTKLAGERVVMAEGGEWVIARTAWLYGRNGRNFVDTLLRASHERDTLSVVTDQVGSPTWTRDLAAAICALLRTGVTGVYHTTNSGMCSRYEQVQEILRVAGLETRLKAVDSSAFPRPAKVPPYSPLDTAKLARDTGHTMRPWQQAQEEYLRTEGLQKLSAS